ncbi:MAG: cbb3-type cytochrome oxidase assembly protein CcoS [Hymenobacteraceae bacterium]|nr:cbb3-type cytochrome oxidase assembly protein CcoS [Hymenobacteraceae bacterium]MDX5481133.1 cbb3-type cytochrome oxidase assembly protein CcoS [Hymenobacteraceae bacterium]
MFVIFLLIGISVTVAACFLGAFLWAVRSGQYDDDYTPAVRMLFENEAPGKPKTAAKKPETA